MSDSELQEALRFLLVPSAERAKLVEAAVSQQVVPPSLDDRVMNALHQRGFIDLRMVGWNAIPIGASVATDGRGNIAVAEISMKGRAWLEAALPQNPPSGRDSEAAVRFLRQATAKDRNSSAIVVEKPASQLNSLKIR